MGERVCGFPGKKLRRLFLGLEGYNRSLFGLLMGCGGTIVEGGPVGLGCLLWPLEAEKLSYLHLEQTSTFCAHPPCSNYSLVIYGCVRNV